MKQRLVALGAALLMLSACSTEGSELPEPVVEDSSLSDQQSQRADQVFQGVEQALTESYKAKSIAGHEDRITGPAAGQLTQEFKLSPILGEDIITQLPVAEVSSSWGESEDFPRLAMAFTKETQEHTTPQLLVLSQAEGRDNYKLWGFASLFLRESKLEFDADAQAIAPDEKENLKASPQEVVAEYGKAYSAQDHTLDFTDDPLQKSIAEQRKALADSVGETGKTQIVGRARDNSEPMSLQTTDGGAVVMAPFFYHIDIELTEQGATIAVGDEMAKVIHGAQDKTSYQVKGRLRAVYDVMVAFYIPPKDSDQKISAIAASRPIITQIQDTGADG